MAYLADTNILLRLLHRDDPDHSVVRSSLRSFNSAVSKFVILHRIWWSSGAFALGRYRSTDSGYR